MTQDPYSRVYHSIIDDDRFREVYPHDGALAAWLRLLMAADAAFPAPAPLPRTLRPAALRTLVDAGIIELVGASHYRVHGLASERQKRSQSARNAAAVRWQSEPHASQAKQSRDETSQAEQAAAPATADSDDPLDLYWQLTGTYPSGTTKAWIGELSAEFGPTATGNALAAEFPSGPRGTVIKRAQNRLRADAEKAERDRTSRAQEAIARRTKLLSPEERAEQQRQIDKLRGELSAVKSIPA